MSRSTGQSDGLNDEEIQRYKSKNDETILQSKILWTTQASQSEIEGK